jgi:hypothetical protein
MLKVIRHELSDMFAISKPLVTHYSSVLLRPTTVYVQPAMSFHIRRWISNSFWKTGALWMTVWPPSFYSLFMKNRKKLRPLTQIFDVLKPKYDAF